MSFRTPWKGQAKVDTSATAKIPNPDPVCKKLPIIEDFEAAVGDEMWPATGPSSPEGSKCTAASEDMQLPNTSECLQDTQGSDSSQMSDISSQIELSSAIKPSEKFKDPGAFNISKDSEHADKSNASASSDDSSEQKLKDSKRPEKSGLKCSEQSRVSENDKSPCSGDPTGAGNNDKSQERRAENDIGTPDVDLKNNSQQASDSKLSSSSKKLKGPRKPKRHMNSKDSAKNKSSQDRKRAKRPRTSKKKKEFCGANSSEDSPSSGEDISRPKAFKSSNKRVENSKKKRREPDGSEVSSLEFTSSTENESPRSSQMQSQATSLGSQFLKQEAPLILSPPPEGLDARARLAWIQQRRNTGVWVYCDNPTCDKQRYLADVYDPAVLPEKWYCRMNKDPERNTCEAAEVGPGIAEEEDMIMSAYTAGSLVWARLDGYPEWPAMVDDDPDYEQYYWCSGYSDVPSDYHVTFFDSAAVSRAWLHPGQIRRFTEKEAEHKFYANCPAKLSRRLEVSHKQAVTALSLTPLERLRKFSFITRYTGKIEGDRKKTIPTPRRLLDEEKDRIKRTRKGGKSQDYDRSSQKNNLSKKKNASQTKKRNKKSTSGKASCDSSEDDENPFTVDLSSVSTDQGRPSQKKSKVVKSTKASSQGSSKAISKIFNPKFKPRVVSPKSASQTSIPAKSLSLKPIPDKAPTSTYNTTTQESTQRTRKLWLELDSSSDSDDCKTTSAAQLPASNVGRTGETEPFVSMSDKQAPLDEEPASEDSTFAFAGSVCSFAGGVQSARKPLDILSGAMDSDIIENTPTELPSGKPLDILPGTMDSDIIENTPTDLPKVKRPSEATAVLSDMKQIVDDSSVFGDEFPKSLDIGDILLHDSDDDNLTDLG